MSLLTAALVLLAGVAVGGFSALFGVGGGLLMVPFMVLALDLTQHVAEGTSLLVIVPTAAAGVLAHRRRGYVSYRLGAMLAAGGIGGAYLGAVVAHRIDPADLQRIFGAFVLLMGARLILQGLRARPSLDDV
jgi:uncharacterized protein